MMVVAARIASCRDMEFPISIKSKPDRMEAKPVYTAQKTVVPRPTPWLTYPSFPSNRRTTGMGKPTVVS